MLEKNIQNVSEENDDRLKKLDSYQRTVNDNSDTFKDLMTNHQTLQGQYIYNKKREIF